MAKTKPKHRPGSLGRAIVLGAVAFTLLYTVLIQGHNMATLNPKGWVAQQQMDITIFSAVLLLMVAVPTVGVLYFFAWKYRESNTKATHDPQMQGGKLFILAAWGIPVAFMSVLSVAMWTSTHRLVPQQPIASKVKPMTVEVVALRWKWMFIYPEQHIATVNFVEMPVNTPVTFELTADDAPMSGFWIPNLGGMLYAMTGHINNLNLIATTPGDYQGSTSEIAGAGFANMKFTARATSQQDFDRWVTDTRYTGGVLDASEYAKLLSPSQSNPPTVYSSYETGLYAKVLMKYTNDMAGMEMK
ncbi:MAG TPA: COX aromatic rich motif-containing protein [Candidatus Saccharimonadia bacterium]